MTRSKELPFVEEIGLEDHELMVRHRHVHESIDYLQRTMNDFERYQSLRDLDVTSQQEAIAKGMATYNALVQHLEARHKDFGAEERESLAELAISAGSEKCPICRMNVH